MAKTLGHMNGASGIAGRKIAALVHFGLLEQVNSGYKPTALTRRICETGSLEGLQRAFLKPPLFQELVDRYRPDGAIPRYFADALPEHGVTEAAKREVARIFMVSGEYAGIFAADGVFLDERSLPNAPEEILKQEAIPSPVILPAPVSQASNTASDSTGQLIRIFLTDRKVAEMKFPAGLNEDDLHLIRAQVDFLELQVRLSRPAATLPFRRPGKAGESA